LFYNQHFYKYNISSKNEYQKLKQYFRSEKVDYDLIIRNLIGTNKNSHNSILIYNKDKVMPVKFDEVALFYTQYEITHVICLNKKSYTVTQSLEELESLTKDIFFRVNRQYLVNRAAVKDAEAYFHRKYVVNVLVDYPEKIIVSKNRVSAFFSWLTQ